MKPQHWILLSLLIIITAWSILRTGNIHPRVEENIDLNWRFIQGDSSSYSQPAFDDSNWQILNLPHNWETRDYRSGNEASGKDLETNHRRISWYRKQLDLSSYRKKEQFYLIFDYINKNTDLWINDVHVKHHENGDMGFYADISACVRIDSINIIAVRIDCNTSGEKSRCTNYVNFGNVKLLATNKLHFPLYHSRITNIFDENGVSAQTEYLIQNNTRHPKRIKVKSVLVSPEGKLISGTISSGIVKKGSDLHLVQHHKIDDPTYWSAHDPSLYTIETLLIKNRRIIDNIRTEFGISNAAFSADSGFVINGQKETIKGVTIYQNSGIDGNAITDASWEYRLKKLKDLGVNALQFTEPLHTPGILYICDRMGFYVIDILPFIEDTTLKKSVLNGDSIPCKKEDLVNYIRRNQNHPSVIAWRLSDEPGKRVNSKADEPVKQVSGKANEPGKQVNVKANDRDKKVNGKADEPAKAARYNSLYDLVQDIDSSRIIATGTLAGTEGRFDWTGIDHYGGLTGCSNNTFTRGLLKTNGFINPFAYYIQSVYSDDPVLNLAVTDKSWVDSMNMSSNWKKYITELPLSRSWNHLENEELELLVFTNCASVELWMNDSLLARLHKENFKNGVLRYSITFRKGKLKALGKVSQTDTLIVTDSLQTAGPAARIILRPDKDILIADGQDVVHIETSIRDKNGILQVNADQVIDYDIEGPGQIKMIDNGDLTDNTSSATDSKAVRDGKQLVIVQATMNPGDLIISASAFGLEPAELKVISVSSDKN